MERLLRVSQKKPRGRCRWAKQAAEEVAFGGFHADHVGAKVGEERSAGWSGALKQELD